MGLATLTLAEFSDSLPTDTILEALREADDLGFY